MKQPLKFCPGGKCYVIDTGKGIALISYTTEVAFIDRYGYLSIRGKYSITTIRHISAFIREYASRVFAGYNLRNWEWLITDKAAINVLTGEVSEWGRYNET